MRVSKEKYRDRINAIYDVCHWWALEDGSYFLISAWELAFHLNNMFYSNLFFSSSEAKKIKMKLEWDDRIILEDYELWHYMSRLITTVKKIKGSKVIKKRSVWFKIPKV